MNEIKRLGLQMVLWVAQVILSNQLGDEDREELGHIATSLYVVKEEPELLVLKPEQPPSTVDTAVANESRRSTRAFAIANNAIYFKDGSDYDSALWEICKTLRPESEQFGERYLDEETGEPNEEDEGA